MQRDKIDLLWLTTMEGKIGQSMATVGCICFSLFRISDFFLLLPSVRGLRRVAVCLYSPDSRVFSIFVSEIRRDWHVGRTLAGDLLFLYHAGKFLRYLFIAAS
jgi:hypothetical protein